MQAAASITIFVFFLSQASGAASGAGLFPVAIFYLRWSHKREKEASGMWSKNNNGAINTLSSCLAKPREVLLMSYKVSLSAKRYVYSQKYMYTWPRLSYGLYSRFTAVINSTLLGSLFTRFWSTAVKICLLTRNLVASVSLVSNTHTHTPWLFTYYKRKCSSSNRATLLQSFLVLCSHSRCRCLPMTPSPIHQLSVLGPLFGSC